MNDAVVSAPRPVNEAVLSYGPGTAERAALRAELAQVAATEAEIPLVIGGRQVTTGRLASAVMPHRHRHVLARCHQASAAEVEQAVQAALAARREWSAMRWEQRAAVFLKAADLLAGPWRMRLNAATMLNQSKTAHQAEIDSACELIDFFRFNVAYAEALYSQQPNSPAGAWNALELRPLEGFVLAVTPFNFTAIAGNLCAAPMLMGNVCLWKPSPSALLSGYRVLELLAEAGLPPGVLNLVPGPAEEVVGAAMGHPMFAGLHFTGSTAVFRSLWKQAAAQLERYRSYPRLVGETGGKDFIVVHPSADPDAVVTGIIRGAFEFQGQKCSAVSRVYVPEPMWQRIKPQLIETTEHIRLGDVADLTNFMGAVINQAAFARHQAAIAAAAAASDAQVIAGGQTDASEGYFVRPTIIEVSAPQYPTMREELFGPIVSVLPFRPQDWPAVLETVDSTSPYALTGAVFATDRRAIDEALTALRYSAGNFYINDKPTGAVVGQQPFGGSRASGTNDKAGSYQNLLRWVSTRTVKETFCPATAYEYPFMNEDTP
jgi:1-pyrroline-5-carboxylate dehydrogenase